MADTMIVLSLAPALSEDRFQRYYEEAGPDYAAWSPHFNMHFGYYRPGMNPFNREAMLEQMNREILDRLNLPNSPAPRVLDMGCGLGATLRSFARAIPKADLHGITLVPWQFEQGRRLNLSSPQTAGIGLALANYENTGFPSESYDAAYAIKAAATAPVPANPGSSVKHTDCFARTAASSLRMVFLVKSDFADRNEPSIEICVTAG